MIRIARLTLGAAAAMLSVAVHAETQTLQLWTCTVNAGKTLADVQAVDAAWVKFINARVKGGGIHSAVVTPVTGTGNLDQFMYLDTYPSIEKWAEQQTVMATPEGLAQLAEFEAVSKCTVGNLYSAHEG